MFFRKTKTPRGKPMRFSCEAERSEAHAPGFPEFGGSTATARVRSTRKKVIPGFVPSLPYRRFGFRKLLLHELVDEVLDSQLLLRHERLRLLATELTGVTGVRRERTREARALGQLGKQEIRPNDVSSTFHSIEWFVRISTPFREASRSPVEDAPYRSLAQRPFALPAMYGSHCDTPQLR